MFNFMKQTQTVDEKYPDELLIPLRFWSIHFTILRGSEAMYSRSHDRANLVHIACVGIMRNQVFIN